VISQPGGGSPPQHRLTPLETADTTPPASVEPYLTVEPDGSFCMAPGPPAREPGRVFPCPITPARPPAPPRVVATPATLATQFWQTIPLPVPRPTIPPAFAVTGKRAYLVTDGTVEPARYVRPTPLGPLTIHAHGSYRVDWGDGSSPTWTGPYLREGVGYPNGTIFHTYDTTGEVTVTVQEVWTATWSLGAAVGTLEGLHTTAVIAGFPVEQIQAVSTG